MKVLVVGGSGFVGGRLRPMLIAAGHEVVSLDLRDPGDAFGRAVIGDVCSLDDLVSAGAGCDVIVNLAAEHRDDVRPISRYDAVNVDGARQVCAAADALGIRQILFTSSVAVYGLDGDNPDESTTPVPFNDYGRTKLLAEGVYREWAAAGPSAGPDQRGLLIVRPCVVFGEGNRGNVYNLIKQIASGRFVRVGDGTNLKSMCYVGNIATFLLQRLPVAPGVDLLNYADKPDLATKDLVAVVQQALGKRTIALPPIPLPIGLAVGSVIDLVARLTKRTFPVSKIRIRKFAADTRVNADRVDATGFQRPTALPDALRATIAAEFPDGRSGAAARR